MIITDCFWEKRNLGETVIEISLEKEDKLDDKLLQKYNDIDYVVVKVPINKFNCNYILGENGYILSELQMEMTAIMKDFNFNHKLIKWVYPHVEFKKVDGEDSLSEVLSKIDSSMFTTDRISIDAHFGAEVGCNRYKNWIRDEYDKKKSEIIQFIYRGKHVGFMMYRESKITRGLLGGVYPEYQSLGLGLLTPSALPLYIQKNNLLASKIVADISSNNKPVWELYESFGYKVTNSHYVFIKHNNNE